MNFNLFLTMIDFHWENEMKTCWQRPTRNLNTSNIHALIGQMKSPLYIANKHVLSVLVPPWLYTEATFPTELKIYIVFAIKNVKNLISFKVRAPLSLQRWRCFPSCQINHVCHKRKQIYLHATFQILHFYNYGYP